MNELIHWWKKEDSDLWFENDVLHTTSIGQSTLVELWSNSTTNLNQGGNQLEICLDKTGFGVERGFLRHQAGLGYKFNDVSLNFEVFRSDSCQWVIPVGVIYGVATISMLLQIKVGLGISRTNADSQWNPVYNVFHRNFCYGNETVRR